MTSLSCSLAQVYVCVCVCAHTRTRPHTRRHTMLLILMQMSTYHTAEQPPATLPPSPTPGVIITAFQQSHRQPSVASTKGESLQIKLPCLQRESHGCLGRLIRAVILGRIYPEAPPESPFTDSIQALQILISTLHSHPIKQELPFPLSS